MGVEVQAYFLDREEGRAKVKPRTGKCTKVDKACLKVTGGLREDTQTGLGLDPVGLGFSALGLCRAWSLGSIRLID